MAWEHCLRLCCLGHALSVQRWGLPKVVQHPALTRLSPTGSKWLQIDTIIRRARPKVCTRHVSPQHQDKQAERFHDGASSAVPAVSNQRQGYLSASNTPKRLHDNKFNTFSRSSTKPGGEIARSPSNKSTKPGLPVLLDASEGAPGIVITSL